MIITLMTDFGYRDPFAGMMKGVIKRISPEAEIIDLTHGITPHDITEAAFALTESYRYFPAGTVHVVVVDPGVGSARRRIIAAADGHVFIGPDNGVLSGVLAADAAHKVHEIATAGVMLNPSGATFDGRDVFAPAAAWRTLGRELSEFGPSVDNPVLLTLPVAELRGDRIAGEVIHIDAFGNLITNIRADDLRSLGAGTYQAEVGTVRTSVVSCYADGRCEIPHALLNSSGYVEIFLTEGNAAERLGVKRGERVTVTLL